MCYWATISTWSILLRNINLILDNLHCIQLSLKLQIEKFQFTRNDKTLKLLVARIITIQLLSTEDSAKKITEQKYYFSIG